MQKTSKKARKSAKVQPEKPMSKAKLREKGTDLARQARIDHALFQREHYAHGVEEKPGHWRNLLMATAAPDEILRPLTCQVCIRLRQRMLEMGTDQAEATASNSSAVVAAEEDAVMLPQELGPQVHHKGRPRTGAPRCRLAAYIREKRSQVYTQTSQSWSKQAVYYCRAYVRLRRNSAATRAKRKSMIMRGVVDIVQVCDASASPGLAPRTRTTATRARTLV